MSMNWKRTVAVILCAAMLITPALGVYTDQEKITETRAVGVLTELGVMEGKDTGAFDPAGTLTRAEAAKLLAYVMTGSRFDEDFARGYIVLDPQTYSDVTAEHWAKWYVEFVNIQGIVAGKGNGRFDPEGKVTGSELAKMLLVALGYDAEDEGLVGRDWKLNTNARAMETGLFAGLEDMDTDAPIVREDAARLVYNALTIPMVQYDHQITSVDGQLQSRDEVRIKDPAETLLGTRFSKGLENGRLVPLL